MKTYGAPWGAALVTMSMVATLAALVPAAIFLVLGRWLPPGGPGAGAARWLPCVGLLPPVLVAVCALFTIRAYTLTENALLVHRLLWKTRLPLEGLRSAVHEPDVMRGSLRTFGNGGAFSFSGFYRNEALGPYRAFVTDGRRTVVLRFADRTVVVSPDDPAGFVREIATPRVRE